MDHSDGRIVGENAVDAVAVGEERFPNCELLVVQTTLVVQYKGSIRIINIIKEKK